MLKLPTTVRYGTRIIVFLALRGDRGPISTKEIAEGEQVSESYTEQILLKLRAAGLVRSQRGASGGYLLAIDPETTTVADIIVALDGPISLISCLNAPCPQATLCVTKAVWERANDALTAVFSEVTIAQLLEQVREAEAASALNYQI